MAGRGVTPPPVEECVYCPMIRAARADERSKAAVHSTGTDTGGPCCECCYEVHDLRNEVDRNAEMNRIVGRDFLADLRAKMESLPDARRVRTRSGAHYGEWHGDGSIWRADVLDVIDKARR
jgi:hypothetical protein